ncbi:HPr-rel-A system PqqD family peptide chaperone [Sphingobium sp. SCG-1]|nr:HPr-rel-A system PqqD family peptide chaperone [Sphingobium sp. SCG-1]
MIVRALDDIMLIYHRPSGQTHMVASPVPEILAGLGSAAMTAGEVVAVLSTQFDIGNAAEAVPAIQVHLDEMAGLGLVRRS